MDELNTAPEVTLFDDAPGPLTPIKVRPPPFSTAVAVGAVIAKIHRPGVKLQVDRNESVTVLVLGANVVPGVAPIWHASVPVYADTE